MDRAVLQSQRGSPVAWGPWLESVRRGWTRAETGHLCSAQGRWAAVSQVPAGAVARGPALPGLPLCLVGLLEAWWLHSKANVPEGWALVT